MFPVTWAAWILLGWLDFGVALTSGLYPCANRMDLGLKGEERGCRAYGQVRLIDPYRPGCQLQYIIV
jgi:hypothetical protein